jgi:hypothetical protein
VYKLYTTIADKEVNLNKTVTSGTVIDNNTITVPDGTPAATYTVYLKAEKNGFTASDAVNAFNITVVEGGTYTVSAVSGG